MFMSNSQAVTFNQNEYHYFHRIAYGPTRNTSFRVGPYHKSNEPIESALSLIANKAYQIRNETQKDKK